MRRFLVYWSLSVTGWSDADLAELNRQTMARNVPAGIRSRLMYAAGVFVQILEGPEEAIDETYERICADPRHASVTLLLDRILRDGASTGEVDVVDDWFASDDGSDSLQHILDSRVGRVIGDSLRVQPRQDRAVETVDRLLVAVEKLAVTQGTGQLTVRTAAAAANVTPQTAYRYFNDTDDLLRTLVRRRQATVFAGAHEVLARASFTGEEDFVEIAVGFILRAHQKKPGVPRLLWQRLLRRYHEIQYDELWLLAETALAALRRSAVPSHHISQEAIAAALAAATAAAKGASLRDPGQLRAPAFRATIAGIVRGALSAPAVVPIAKRDEPMAA